MLPFKQDFRCVNPQIQQNRLNLMDIKDLVVLILIGLIAIYVKALTDCCVALSLEAVFADKRGQQSGCEFDLLPQ